MALSQKKLTEQATVNSDINFFYFILFNDV